MGLVSYIAKISALFIARQVTTYDNDNSKRLTGDDLDMDGRLRRRRVP